MQHCLAASPTRRRRPQPAQPCSLAACGLAACLGATLGNGADALLEDAVITAYPAPTSLIETPLAATVFEERWIGALGIESLAELSLRVPALDLGPPGLSIRGIGAVGAAADPGVALHLDGVYLGDWHALDAANFFDSERIEVLRGPVGVSHGRDGLGGALNLVSTPPPMTWQSKVVLQAGNFDYRVLQGLIRGPITDQFAMSVAGSTLERSAWNEDDSSATDQLPRDDDYLRGAFTYHWNNIWYSRLQAFSARTERGSLDNGYLLNELALGDYRVRYVAAWTERDDTLRSEVISHDLRLYPALEAPVDLEAGIQYIDEEISFEPTGPARDSSYRSAWSRVGREFPGGLRAHLGLRYSEDNLRSAHDETESFWDWSLGLDYRWSDSHLVYASAATGHGRTAPVGKDSRGAQPQALRSLEAGHKGLFFKGRLQTALAVYHYRPDELPGLSDSSVGMEFEVAWQPAERIALGGSWAWADGDRPVLAARHQLALFATALWQWAWVELEGRLEYLSRGGYRQPPGPAAVAAAAGDHRQWDLGLSASYQQWTLGAYIDNLADERSAYDHGGTSPPAALSAPREYGLKLVYQLR